MKGNKIIFLLVAFFSLIHCSEKHQGVQMKSLENQWAKKDTIAFPIEIKDKKNADISLIIRNNNEYPYSNLRMIVSLKEEKNKTITRDTLNYILANPDGQWLGSGFGDTKEIQELYKTKYTFPKAGKYTLQIVHAMRKDTLRGLEDIGIKIEPKP